MAALRLGFDANLLLYYFGVEDRPGQIRDSKTEFV